MSHVGNRRLSSDVLVIFGVTGDLAHKMIFPGLYAMAKRGVLNVPVVGVARSQWTVAQLRRRVRDSVRQDESAYDRAVLNQLLPMLRYVRGDYTDRSTFDAFNRLLKLAWIRHQSG